MASDKAFWQWIERREEARERLKARPPHPAQGRRRRRRPPGGRLPARVGARPRAPRTPRNFEGVTLRVFTQTGPFISGPVKFHAPEFQELTGAVVEAIEAPNADLFARAQQVAQTGSGDFDILLLANTWMPDFVNLEYVIPLQPFIDADYRGRAAGLGRHPRRHQAQELLGRADLHLHRRQRQPDDVLPQGHPRAIPQWQEAFNAADRQGSAQPAADADRVRRGRQVLHPQRRRRGVERRRHRLRLHHLRPARRSSPTGTPTPGPRPTPSLPTDKAPDGTPGIYIFDPDMNPLINTEGYVRGLTEFVDVHPGRHEAGTRRRPRRPSSTTSSTARR